MPDPMPTLPALLVALSALIIFALGLLHLWITFRGTGLQPRDAALLQALKAVSPMLTRETTMWNAWIGFNASHSFGALLFGVIYGYLALAAPALLFSSLFLRAVGLLLLGAYAWLGKRYWFRIPFRGIVAALLCYVLALALAAWGQQ